jgi:hypothetical protein
MGIEKICVPSPVGACGHFFIHTPSRRQCYIRFPGRTGHRPREPPVARVRCGRLCAVCPARSAPDPRHPRGRRPSRGRGPQPQATQTHACDAWWRFSVYQISHRGTFVLSRNLCHISEQRTPGGNKSLRADLCQSTDRHLPALMISTSVWMTIAPRGSPIRRRNSTLGAGLALPASSHGAVCTFTSTDALVWRVRVRRLAWLHPLAWEASHSTCRARSRTAKAETRCRGAAWPSRRPRAGLKGRRFVHLGGRRHAHWRRW